LSNSVGRTYWYSRYFVVFNSEFSCRKGGLSIQFNIKDHKEAIFCYAAGFPGAWAADYAAQETKEFSVSRQFTRLLQDIMSQHAPTTQKVSAI